MKDKIRLFFFSIFCKIIPISFIEQGLIQYRLSNFLQYCTCGQQTKLYPSARIINSQHDVSKITIGSHTHIEGELLIRDQGGNIFIGDYCYVGKDSRIWSSANINIGNKVLISHNVNIHDNNSHPLDADLRHIDFLQGVEATKNKKQKFDIRSAPINIKDNAWIGFNSIILKGVTIGEGAIIGAGSVVTKDVPDFAVVAGNPAQIIRYMNI
ncbi:CatB-related O-acetyltransferase [Cytophagaceae bacterium DM2B3-1]|uniref:CatB-related O-acetyltransferase n=1 Tax=Xanthocytophaga flava TaxID=3048013 RepID=A0ABT7CE40_9BACT|nr:CatB-related O-acetyltransferase [Xanthocytophaga flavus]MDJ1473721.1 CatB-related O-acetyltransferase [Xanthocytophaga flavus]MDJ1491958.1 CatB-related O-acetyltransferase [Xanthocytophaga flavus]